MDQQDAAKTFEPLVKEHEALLHKICRLYAFTAADRQDLFQEMVIQLWKAFPKYKGLAKFSTWMYRVALNTAITGLRRKKDFIVSYEPSELPQHSNEGHNEAEEEQVKQLYKAIARLNEIDKAIVLLFLEDHSYEGMEEILGISSGNLRVKMVRIKNKLRQLTNTPDYGT